MTKRKGRNTHTKPKQSGFQKGMATFLRGNLKARCVVVLQLASGFQANETLLAGRGHQRRWNHKTISAGCALAIHLFYSVPLKKERGAVASCPVCRPGPRMKWSSDSVKSRAIGLTCANPCVFVTETTLPRQRQK
jgi:hypothetical protein